MWAYIDSQNFSVVSMILLIRELSEQPFSEAGVSHALASTYRTITLSHPHWPWPRFMIDRHYSQCIAMYYPLHHYSYINKH
jgi:hypothetical protein